MDMPDSKHAETEAPSPKAPLEPVYPWKKAWQTAKAIWPQLVYISLASMSIPQYLLFVFSTEKASQRSEAFAVHNAVTLEHSFEILRAFVADYLGDAWLAASLFLLGSFTIIALVGQSSRSEEISTPKAFRTAIRTLLPLGIFYLIFLGLLSLFGLNIAVQILPAQFIKFFGLIGLILLSALPTLMTIEPKGFVRSTRQALRMSYAQFTGISKWSIFFLLMTYQLLAINLVAISEWASRELSTLDQRLGLGREVFFRVSDSAPFGQSLYFAELMNVGAFTLSAVGFIILSSSLIFEIYRRHALGRTISLIV